MMRTEPHIRSMSEYSAQVAQRIADAAYRDDFLESETLSDLVDIFIGRNSIAIDDIERVLGTAQGCLEAARILDGKGMDGEGLYAMGMDLLSAVSSAYGHVLAVALSKSGDTIH